MRYKLLVWSLRLVVLVARLVKLKGHVVADAEGDSGYWKLGAHHDVRLVGDDDLLF